VQPEHFARVGVRLTKLMLGRQGEYMNSILTDGVDYLMDFMAIGVFIICFVLVWFITLLVFKCLGRYRVGCAAGFAFHDENTILKEARAEAGKGSKGDNDELDDMSSSGSDYSSSGSDYSSSSSDSSATNSDDDEVEEPFEDEPNAKDSKEKTQTVVTGDVFEDEPNSNDINQMIRTDNAVTVQEPNESENSASLTASAETTSKDVEEENFGKLVGAFMAFVTGVTGGDNSPVVNTSADTTSEAIENEATATTETIVEPVVAGANTGGSSPVVNTSADTTSEAIENEATATTETIVEPVVAGANTGGSSPVVNTSADTTSEAIEKEATATTETIVEPVVTGAKEVDRLKLAVMSSTTGGDALAKEADDSESATKITALSTVNSGNETNHSQNTVSSSKSGDSDSDSYSDSYSDRDSDSASDSTFDSEFDSEFDDDDLEQFEDEAPAFPYDDVKDKDKDEKKHGCLPFDPHRVASRKLRTRLVFAFFANLALLGCSLLIGHMYAPSKLMVDESEKIAEEIAPLNDGMTQALDSLNKVAPILEEKFYSTTEMQYRMLCPNIPDSEFVSRYGFRSDEIMKKFLVEYYYIGPTIINTVSDTYAPGKTAFNQMSSINGNFLEANKYYWIITLCTVLMMLIIVSQLAMIANAVFTEAVLGKPHPRVLRFEKWYGSVVLPLQLFLVVIAWISVLGFCFGVIVLADTCLPKIEPEPEEFFGVGRGLKPYVPGQPVGYTLPILKDRGTPEDSVMPAIEASLDIPKDGLIDFRAAIDSYLSGCHIDPLAPLVEAQKDMVLVLEYLDDKLRFLEDVDDMKTRCGPNNRVDEYKVDIQVIRNEIFGIHKGMAVLHDAFSCPVINSLYVRTVEEGLCTNMASAMTNGFVDITFISVCMMVLITLRAAWRISL